MIKQNAGNEDLGRVLIEMNIIREEYYTKGNIDKLLFPAIVEPEEAIKLFQVFQMQIQECELNRNIPKGYAYMAWSITLIAHINKELSSLGNMLWKELKRGIKSYENESLKSWEKFPIF